MKTAIFNFFRRLFGRAPEQWATGYCRCCLCGHECVSVISTHSPCYNHATGDIEGVECSRCHKMSVYSQ